MQNCCDYVLQSELLKRETELLYLTEYEKQANQYAMSAHELIALGNGACIEASIFNNVLEDYVSSWPLCLMAGIFVNCVSVPAFVFLFSCTTLDVL